ncbi:MAG: hypothetical protein ACFFB0_11375 [Promethearchaeota archaeon]
MIDQLNSKLEDLELKKQDIKPKIDEINARREKELQDVNKKYDHLISEISFEIEKLENDLNNELIQSFEEAIMQEFDAKRSNSMYEVTSVFKEYRNSITKFSMFPKELLEKLDKIIEGDLIDNLAYNLENIKAKYMKS